MQVLIHRMNQSRPHISSDTCDFKERGSEDPETKSTEMRPNFRRAPPRMPQMFLASRTVWLVPSGRLAPRVGVSAASVKGYLRFGPVVRKRFFRRNCIFWETFANPLLLMYLFVFFGSRSPPSRPCGQASVTDSPRPDPTYCAPP